MYRADGGWIKVEAVGQGVYDNVYYNERNGALVCGEKLWQTYSDSNKFTFTEVGVEVKLLPGSASIAKADVTGALSSGSEREKAFLILKDPGSGIQQSLIHVANESTCRKLVETLKPTLKQEVTKLVGSIAQSELDGIVGRMTECTAMDSRRAFKFRATTQLSEGRYDIYTNSIEECRIALSEIKAATRSNTPCQPY